MSNGDSGHAAPETFESLRPLLFAIAYRMLASVSDAEDVLQEAFLRYQRAMDDGVVIASLKAYLSTIVTRLAMDHLQSAPQRREEYVGIWLPDPLFTDQPSAGPTGLISRDPQSRVEMAESLSMAFLLLLERLNPIERAVFVLHDVFGYAHEEIATIVNVSVANSRQIAARARRRIHDDRPRFEASPEARDELAERFFSAVTDGDVDGLLRMLADDVVVYGDGGGKAPQWAGPIAGTERVARLLAGVGVKLREFGARVERRHINGQPGVAVMTPDGDLISVFVIDIVDGVVHAVRSVINPDKLRHLGPVADVRGLSAARRHDT